MNADSREWMFPERHDGVVGNDDDGRTHELILVGCLFCNIENSIQEER